MPLQTTNAGQVWIQEDSILGHLKHFTGAFLILLTQMTLGAWGHICTGSQVSSLFFTCHCNCWLKNATLRWKAVLHLPEWCINAQCVRPSCLLSLVWRVKIKNITKIFCFVQFVSDLGITTLGITIVKLKSGYSLLTNTMDRIGRTDWINSAQYFMIPLVDRGIWQIPFLFSQSEWPCEWVSWL